MTAPVHATLAALSTVHVGQSAVLLLSPGGVLVPVTSSARGLVPGGICLPVDADYAVFAAVAGQHALLDLRDWSPLLGRTPRTSLVVQQGPVDATAAEGLEAAALIPVAPERSSTVTPAPGGPMDPHPVRRRARLLVRLAGAGAVPSVRRFLVGLVGVGPGSTPTGDDVVVGALAGLDRRGDGPALAAAGLLRAALPELLDRTTTLSRHDLQAALDGEVAERVHHLLTAVGDRRRVPAAVRAAHAWGASSGLDLAVGVAAGALGPTRAVRPFAPQTRTLRRSA